MLNEKSDIVRRFFFAVGVIANNDLISSKNFKYVAGTDFELRDNGD